MDKAKIARINELARKSKEIGLTESEKTEQAALRREYIDSVKGSLERHLDRVWIADGKGGEYKLRKKAKNNL